MNLIDFFAAIKMPVSRANDVAMRAESNGLTFIEKLAIAILRGDSEDQMITQQIIDKAYEEYNHGTYRVPVRVIADWSKVFVVASVEGRLHDRQRENLRADLTAFMARSKTDGCVLVVDSGLKLEIYEVQNFPEDAARVDICENVQPEHSE